MSPWGANFRNTNLDFFQEYEGGPLAQATVGVKQLLWLIRRGTEQPQSLGGVCGSPSISLGSGATAKRRWNLSG